MFCTGLFLLLLRPLVEILLTSLGSTPSAPENPTFISKKKKKSADVFKKKKEKKKSEQEGSVLQLCLCGAALHACFAADERMACSSPSAQLLGFPPGKDLAQSTVCEGAAGSVLRHIPWGWMRVKKIRCSQPGGATSFSKGPVEPP